MLDLKDWEDYYTLRGLSPASPIALIMTFPLTLYYAIYNHGTVPAAVAAMMNRRPLRVHCVGAEKEMNLLDSFTELGYLLPLDMKVRLRGVWGRGVEEGVTPLHTHTHT